jgi:hypothetical protein
MDWLKKIAPTLVSCLAGPAAGAFVELIGGALGMDSPTVDSVKTALSSGNLTGDQMLKIKEIEASLKDKEMEMGFRFADLEFQKEKLYVDDVADARHAHAQNENVFYLGVATILVFAGLMAAVLTGCYFLLTQGIPIKDPGVIAVVFSLIGSIVTLVGSNAQQVYSYFFGSSRGSQEKSGALAAAIEQMKQIAGKK